MHVVNIQMLQMGIHKVSLTGDSPPLTSTQFSTQFLGHCAMQLC